MMLIIGFTCTAQETIEVEFSTDCGKNVFITTDEKAVPKQTKKQIEAFLASEVDIPDRFKETEGRFYFSQTIDCTGKSIRIHVKRSAYPQLDEKMIQCIAKNLTWNPGKQKTFPVNSIFEWEILLKNGKFEILNRFQL